MSNFFLGLALKRSELNQNVHKDLSTKAKETPEGEETPIKGFAFDPNRMIQSFLVVIPPKKEEVVVTSYLLELLKWDLYPEQVTKLVEMILIPIALTILTIQILGKE
jgi:hypothetical protein